MSEAKTYYKNFVTMLSGNALSQVVPFIIAPILTRLFSPEDFAIYTNFLAISTMIGIVAAGRLELAIPISKHKKEAQHIVLTGLTITAGLAVFSLVFPLFSNSISNWYESPELADYLIYVPIAVMTFGFLGIATNWVLRAKKYSALSISKVGQSLFNNGLAALFGYLGWGVSGLVTGWFLGQIVGIMLLVIFIDRPGRKHDFTITSFKTTIKEYKDFPMINSLHAFTDIFATQFLLFWIITYAFGMKELGLFAMMNKYVRAPIILITSSVSQIFYAEVSSSLNKGLSPVPILKKTLSTSIAFSIPFLTIILLLGPDLFEWYFGEEWRIAGEYAQMISPMLFLFFILSPISSIPILFNQQKRGFLFAIMGYTVTLSTLWVAARMELTFAYTLLAYSCAFAVFQLFYLYWLYTLIKKAHARSN